MCIVRKCMLNTDRFIELGIAKYGKCFTYDSTVYTTCETKVVVTCPVHGDWIVSPMYFLHRKHSTCPECRIPKNRLSTDKFIENSIAIHGNKYSYEKTKYINARTKLEIECPFHGPFLTLPKTHTSQQSGCPVCGNRDKISRFKNNINNSTDPVHIYVFKIISNDECFYKVGITKQTPAKRSLHIRCMSQKHYTVEIIYFTKKIVPINRAVLFENKCDQLFAKFKYNPSYKFDGYTECFSHELDITLVIHMLENNEF